MYAEHAILSVIAYADLDGYEVRRRRIHRYAGLLRHVIQCERERERETEREITRQTHGKRERERERERDK